LTKIGSYSFQSCTKLASIPSLPATTLVSHCYYGMFGSTNITDGLIENVYNSISNITSLAPYCYAYMFSNCTKLTSVPKLPATIMQSHCYDNMFYNCNNAGFNTTPELKATSLADYCYNKMFCGCTYLKDASNVIIDPTNNTIPDNCCNSMFDGCSNLNIGYPHIADKEYSVGTGSFAYMFRSCKFDTNNNFEPKFTISTVRNIYFSSYDGPCEQMFYGSNIANAGGVTISTTKSTSYSYKCCYQMFRNCTNLINPPILSATNLSTDCYFQMFYGCTSLTTAPALPATTLANSCYYQMFYNCSSLEKAPDLPATTLQSNCYYQMFYNCSKLKEVFANFTTSIYNIIQAGDGDISYTYPYTSAWLSGTPNSSDCKFIHNSNATWVESINANAGALRGVSTVPKYWTMTPQTE
jgi:hypothetical protein